MGDVVDCQAHRHRAFRVYRTWTAVFITVVVAAWHAPDLLAPARADDFLPMSGGGGGTSQCFDRAGNPIDCCDGPEP